MKVKEVATYLQISKDLVYKWAQEGKIPVSKLGSQWRFNRKEIDEWAKSQRPVRKQRGGGLAKKGSRLSIKLPSSNLHERRAKSR